MMTVTDSNDDSLAEDSSAGTNQDIPIALVAPVQPVAIQPVVPTTTPPSFRSPPVNAHDAPSSPLRARDILLAPFRWMHSIVEWFFGLYVLIGALALAASLPLIQFIALGYLLETSGRIVRLKKIRAGFWGIRTAARAGGVISGTLIVWLPAYFHSIYYLEAQIMLPGSERAAQYGWETGVLALITSLYTLWAWLRGGKLRHFFWPAPIRFFREAFRREIYIRTHDQFWEFIRSLELPALWKLGFQGFMGTFCWLVVPIALCIGGMTLPRGLNIVSGLIGYIALAVIFLYLPMLQTRFAVERRLTVFKEITKIREMYRRAPIALWVSMVAVWMLAIPVYAVKVELTPREVVLLPAVIFIMFAWPARVMLGWAYGRAKRREQTRHPLFVWIGRLTLVPVVLSYGSIVLASRYTSWYGEWSLFEQHALLVPIPFLSF